MNCIHHQRSPLAEHICHIWPQGGRALALNTKWLLFLEPSLRLTSQTLGQREPPACSRQTPCLGYSHDAPAAQRMQNEAARTSGVVKGLFNVPML